MRDPGLSVRRVSVKGSDVTGMNSLWRRWVQYGRREI